MHALPLPLHCDGECANPCIDSIDRSRRFDDLLLHLCVEPVAADGFAKAIAVVSANADADAPTLTVAEYAAAVQVSGPSDSSAAPKRL